jgi:hypothetical protein
MGTIPNGGAGGVPDGARLLPPTGFAAIVGPGPNGHLILNKQTATVIALAALPVGVDESNFVQKMQAEGAKPDGSFTVQSANGLRNGLRFSTKVNKVPVLQFVVFYPNRLFVLAQVPVAVAQQRGFEQAAREFWARNVVLP